VGAALSPVRPGVTTAGVKIPIERLEPEAVFETGGHPDWLAVAETEASVWVSNHPLDNVSRFDAKSNVVAATVHLGLSTEPCSGLVAGFGSVWVPCSGWKHLFRVDLKTSEVTAMIPTTIGFREGSVAAGAGSVWLMTNNKGTLSRFDPATNKIAAKISVATGSYGLTFGEDAVWVTSTRHGTVTRVDPDTNRVVASIPVRRSPRFIAAGEGAIWALNQGDGSVSRIDPNTNQVVATIDVGVPGAGGDIAVGEGSVWVASFDYPLSRIDPSTNQVVQQFYGPGGDAVAVGLGSVWLSNLREGNVWRLDPRRVEATAPE
jgi:YVTN family beta-propeller protein